MLAGLRPRDLSAAELMDAEWAALVEMIGPGEHVTDLWAELTGDDMPRLSGEAHGEDSDMARAVASLPDDDLRRWVPAYAKAFESGDDEALAALDRDWAHTAKYAAGMQSLATFAGGDISGSRGETDATPVDQPAPAAPVSSMAVGFGMPPGMDD